MDIARGIHFNVVVGKWCKRKSLDEMDEVWEASEDPDYEYFNEDISDQNINDAVHSWTINKPLAIRKYGNISEWDRGFL